MALADANLIDCDSLQVAKFRAIESSAQISLEYVLYGIPSDLEVVGNIGNGHMPAKFQDIAFKGSGVGTALIGKAQFDLTHDITAQTLNTLDRQLNEYRCRANWNCSKSAHDCTSSPYEPRFAVGAPEGKCVSSDTKDNGAIFKYSANILIAVNTESVIQQACGHPLCLSIWCGAY
jgi:hypothetical protein